MVDKVKFWFSGEVPCFGEIMVDIFDSSSEKFTFVESEADSIIEKIFTDAFKVYEDFIKVATEEKNVINNGATAIKSLFLLI